MIVTSNLIQTSKVVTINQNRWSRSVKFTGHDLLEWVVTVDQNTHLWTANLFQRELTTLQALQAAQTSTQLLNIVYIKVNACRAC